MKTLTALQPLIDDGVIDEVIRSPRFSAKWTCRLKLRRLGQDQAQ
jgi:hypothetical protein